MDEPKNRIEKIYTRNQLKIPKVQCFFAKDGGKNKEVKLKIIRKVASVLLVLTIAFLVVKYTYRAIEPIVKKQCITIARSIATKISNEQATAVMKDYHYEDFVNVTKDESGNIKMVSSNMITINKIISDIPILIQNDLDNIEKNRFHIRLGTFSGSKLLSGRGPNIEFRMLPMGSIETDLRSEFTSSGINQTLHRIYLEVRCNVIIITPFNTIEEQIINQVLLSEGVIVGNIPNTYYNLEGLNKDNLIDVIE